MTFLIDTLQALSAYFSSEPLTRRWVVLDLETTGLNVRTDEVLAVAALALHLDEGKNLRIDYSDTFEVLVNSNKPLDKNNVLVHRIGSGLQKTGLAPSLAFAQLKNYLGSSPVFAYHADFDRSILNQTAKRLKAKPLPNAWIDIAPLASAAHPAQHFQSLDAWLAHFNIACQARHQAMHDTIAEAQLLLRSWHTLKANHHHAGDLAKLARQQRWIEKHAKV